MEIETKEFLKCGQVFNQDGLTVTSFETDHGEKIKPNWGYKIQYSGRTVVISGDAKNDIRVSEIAKNSDLLFHSLGAAKDEIKNLDDINAILQHHTTPKEAAKIFSLSRPKLAVIIHMVLLGKPGFPPMTTMEILETIQKYYNGPLTIAEDLMKFEVGEKVKVIPKANT